MLNPLLICLALLLVFMWMTLGRFGFGGGMLKTLALGLVLVIGAMWALNLFGTAQQRLLAIYWWMLPP